MAINNAPNWFDSSQVEEASGLKDWQCEVFERAYCREDGPFWRVIERLRSGFPVLVYLPGNCMSAASECVRRSIRSTEWEDYGKHTGTGSIAEVWSKTSGVVDAFLKWVGKQGERHNAIFHNLDLLGDGHGAVFGAVEAQTAVFSIIEATRNGAALGLADRAAGRLPERLESAFGETVWLDEIPIRDFGGLIPAALGEKLQHLRGDEGVPEGIVWLLASRLRWTDPIHAVRIMENAARGKDWQDITRAIWRATRSINFADPSGGKSEKLTGVPDHIMKRIEQQIVVPFTKFMEFAETFEGGRATREGESRLLRLVPGVILHGPPGTGKTHAARWLAEALQLPVRVVAGSDIKAGPWGDAEKNVRRVFEEARRAAPCVLVFDDADDLFPDRNRAQGSLAGAERSVVDAALQQLEGFLGRPSGVLVILTTNRFNEVDPAIRRRLKLHIRIPYPLTEGQVREIVTTIASDYSLRLEEPIMEQLVERFMGPVALRGGGAPPGGAAQREIAESNLFSPSEIQLAMQMLEDMNESERYQDGVYVPTADDVSRMEEYYSQLPPPGTR